MLQTIFVLRKRSKFTAKTSGRESYFSKVARCRLAALLKKESIGIFFHANLANFSRSQSVQNTSVLLFLEKNEREMRIF